AGILNQPPVASKQAYQINVQTLGRLATPEQFASIVLKSDNEGRVTRLRDVGRVEIGAADYGSTAFMDRGPGMPLLIFAQPGANSLAVEHEVLDTMETLGKTFPPGLDYKVIYDATIFVGKSVDEVIKTIFVAILLVVGVVFLFLQSWRAAIIPVIAIPVSLLGTFTFLYVLGISLNNLSLFGLVLARHRGRRRHCRGGKCRAQSRARHEPGRGRPCHDERGRRRADLDRADAVCGVRTVGVPVGHLRPVLPAVRGDDCCLDADLLLRLADLEPRALCGAIQGA